MKKRYFFNLLALLFLFGVSQLTSCRTPGEGCEGSEKYFNQNDGAEEGAELSTKRGKSGLFGGKKKKRRSKR